MFKEELIGKNRNHFIYKVWSHVGATAVQCSPAPQYPSTPVLSQLRQQSPVHPEPQRLPPGVVLLRNTVVTTIQALQGCWVGHGSLSKPRAHPAAILQCLYSQRWLLTLGSASCVLLRTEWQPWVTHTMSGYRGRVRILYFCVCVDVIKILESSRKSWAHFSQWIWVKILTQSLTPLSLHDCEQIVQSFWASVSSPVR